MDLRDLAWSATHKAWERMSHDIGAEFVPPEDFSHPGRVEATVRDWTVTLRMVWVAKGNSGMPYTVLEAPYDAQDDFSFLVKSTSLGRALLKLLGFKGLPVGDAMFDRAFFVTSDDPSKVQMLLANGQIRSGLIQAQSHSWFNPLSFTTSDPLGVAEEDTSLLMYEANQMPLTYPAAEAARLKTLFNVMADTLDELRVMGLADPLDDDAPVEDDARESAPQAT
jgi:hypothetical protein